MFTQSKSVVLYSGGLDSTVLLHKVVKECKTPVYALSFDYGQRISEAELCTAGINCDKLGVIHRVLDISFFKTFSNSALTDTTQAIPKIWEIAGDAQPPTYVPNRNMMLLSIATAFAESVSAEVVYYGAAEVDTHSGHWDCSQDFLQRINGINSLNRKFPVRIEAPLITYTKADIVKAGQDLGVRFDETHTCYTGKRVACGVCSACSSRIQGFLDAGIKDTIEYAIKIPWNN